MRLSTKSCFLTPLLLVALVGCQSSIQPAESLARPPSPQPQKAAAPAAPTASPPQSMAAEAPRPAPDAVEAPRITPETLAACEEPGSLEGFGPPDRTRPRETPAPDYLEGLQRDWREQSWSEQATRAPFQKLGGEKRLKTGELIRVRIPVGQAVILDLSAAEYPSEVTMVPFLRGKPQRRIWEDLELPREHWIVVVPRPEQPRADEVVLHVDEGSVLVKMMATRLATNGRIDFPPNLALGQEPQGRGPNCGPEHLYDFKKRIDSVAAAVELVRELYLEPNGPLGNLATCRVVAKSYRTSTPPNPADIDWQRMSKRVQQRRVGERTIYELTYSADRCGPDSFVLRVSSDGWASTFGCCGK